MSGEVEPPIAFLWANGEGAGRQCMRAGSADRGVRIRLG